MGDAFPDYGGKVKFFSNTAGTGFKGAVRRAKRLVSVPPNRLVNTAYRKVRKKLSPETMPFAQAIHIEVTNACNLKCVMCPRLTMDRKVGYMDRLLFEKIVSQLAPHHRILEGVALMGLGEPLLHKELEAFSRIAARAELPNVYTSTNGVLLTEQRSESLLSQGAFERIIISLDGATKKTFETIRAGAKFETVYQNVETFLRMKKGRRTPTTSLQILLMEETEGELRDFCDYWVPLLGPSDEILVKEIDTFGGQVDDRRTDKNREPSPRFACRQLWRDMSISWDGWVTVCCKDVLYKLAVGNADRIPLEEIWRSQKWETIRRLHKQGDYSMVPCDRCKEWYV